MSGKKYHIAQFNIVTMRYPLDDPRMAEFVNLLGPINAVADEWEGFVWRLQSAEGDATSIRIYDDERILVNMSVWASVEALFQYTYASGHVDVFRRRAEWFEKHESNNVLVLWRAPAGHIPTPQEGKERLEYLQQHGATPYAFTFKKRFAVAELQAE